MDSNSQEIKAEFYISRLDAQHQGHMFKSCFLRFYESYRIFLYASHTIGKTVIIVLVICLYFLKKYRCFLLNLALHQVEYITKSEVFFFLILITHILELIQNDAVYYFIPCSAPSTSLCSTKRKTYFSEGFILVLSPNSFIWSK